MKIPKSTDEVSRVDPIASAAQRPARRVSDVTAQMARQRAIPLEQKAEAPPEALRDGRSLKRRPPSWQLNVRIDERTRERLYAYCDRTGLPITATVEAALSRFLDTSDEIEP